MHELFQFHILTCSNPILFEMQYERIMQEYLDENKRQRDAVKAKKGSDSKLHTYTPEEFSVTAKELSEGDFATYVKKYNVPMSAN